MPLTREDQREREERAHNRTFERIERKNTMLIVEVQAILRILIAPIFHPMFDEREEEKDVG